MDPMTIQQHLIEYLLTTNCNEDEDDFLISNEIGNAINLCVNEIFTDEGIKKGS